MALDFKYATCFQVWLSKTACENNTNRWHNKIFNALNFTPWAHPVECISLSTLDKFSNWRFFGWRRGFVEVLIWLCYVLIWYWYGLKMAIGCKLQSVRAYLIQYLDRALMCPLCNRFVLRGKNQNGTNHCFFTRAHFHVHH